MAAIKGNHQLGSSRKRQLPKDKREDNVHVVWVDYYRLIGLSEVLFIQDNIPNSLSKSIGLPEAPSSGSKLIGTEAEAPGIWQQSGKALIPHIERELYRAGPKPLHGTARD